MHRPQGVRPAAGQRFSQAGKHELLCVIHQAGVETLAQRCDSARTSPEPATWDRATC
ncbi:hypothetical protein [Saccharopolyspora sp. NPDC049357]|uniref:hypothetical protein n=1 Tax=Saccharopolyspora sp. NPDC049357 TaxID=3154507 RepID=UPI003425370A